MRFLALGLLLLCLVVSIHGQETEDNKPNEDSWWARFKQRVKTVLSKWRDDIKLLWDDVLTKADDMKSWTSEMFDSFKLKLKEWLETRSEIQDDEKNEIETFISKLKVPTDSPETTPPKKERNIDP